MTKRKQKAPPTWRTFDVTRGMAYQPNTPLGNTALEHRNAGPFRPGKTARDWGGR